MPDKELGISLDQLVALYKSAQASVGDAQAARIVAEALTSESTAVAGNAAEAIAITAAEAIQALSPR